MQRWWKNIKLAGYDAHPLMQALLSGDIAGLVRETCSIMDDSISVNDAKEDFYHGMMVGVLRTQGNVKSNREYGEGRPDIVFKDRNRAIILELKCLLPSVVNKYPFEQQFEKVPLMMQALQDEAEAQIKYAKGSSGGKEIYRGEFVEFLTLKGGNLGGLELVSGSDGESKKYCFPDG